MWSFVSRALARSARVDVRSSSRHGDHDLGRNAERVRVLFSEVKTRLSELEKTETMEKAVALREMRMKKALEKKEREREIAEREERRRQQQRAAAISRERQISSNENAGQRLRFSSHASCLRQELKMREHRISSRSA